MNILLWILQVLLSLHTAIGAIWKLSNSEQTVPALQVIPHAAWLAMIGFELLCSFGLIVPVLKKSWAILISLAAAGIAAEMLLFCALQIYSGETDIGSMIYWLVVAAVCAFIAYGRLVLKRLS